MRITILGAGKLGANIAQTLIPGGHEITIIDNNADLIDRLGSRMDIQCINANAKDIDSMKNANVQDTDVLITTTNSDDKNIVLACVGKQLGAKKCIARIRSVEQLEELDLIKKGMSIDKIINPDYTCAKAIYKNLTRINGFGQGLQMKNGLTLVEFAADKVPHIVGNSLKEAASKLGGLLIAAISRNGKIIVPNGDTRILEGDGLYAIGSKDSVKQMRFLSKSGNEGEHLQNVMIAGGGKTGLFLAKFFLSEGVNVKVIENDKDRAEKLAVALDGASIVYGDATDPELLFEEELEKMDAFISVSGMDEGNFMLALYAKQHGVEKVVAKMANRSYVPMIENFSDVMIINDVELCTAEVVNSIKEDDNIVFSKLIQGQAEFLEIAVAPNMTISEKMIKDLSIPEGIIIAAVFRNGELIIPKGKTFIQNGDRVVMLSLLSKITELQQFLKSSIDESLI